MSLLDTFRKSLSPELFAQVTDALGDDFNYDQVPRSRLNTVISQREQARRERDDLMQSITEGVSFTNEAGSSATNSSSNQQQVQTVKSGTFTQADLDAAVKQVQDVAAQEMKNLQLRYAATEKLRGANVVDPELVLSANLIDYTKVTLEDTSALDAQISELIKAKPYLVASAANNNAPTGTGKTGGTDEFASVTSKDEFMKLPTEKQLEFKKANPEVFQGFMKTL